MEKEAEEVAMTEKSVQISNPPSIVPAEEWEAALKDLRAKEKEQMRAGDAVAAERRRLPMVEIEKGYTFEGPEGEESLLDLFEGRPQLIVYHFMFGPGSDEGCDGCSMFVDNLGHLAHLRARDTSFALVSRAPLAKLQEFRRRMGWDVPWYSSFGSDFNVDFGVGPEQPKPDRHQEGEGFGLSVFLRDGDRVFRTYFTAGRGVEPLSSNWALLDLTPLGRQEEWEASPEGRPQSPPYGWWRLHDEYDA
jgi:predicted dithiol-disulfide oxidoreductase (DUF899 family)